RRPSAAADRGAALDARPSACSGARAVFGEGPSASCRILVEEFGMAQPCPTHSFRLRAISSRRMIERDLTEGIATLRLEHGKASALDLELCEALQREIEAAAESDDVRALILTGTGSIFSAGVDLPRLINGGKEYVQDFVEALDAMLRALFLFPKPAIAAINGQ